MNKLENASGNLKEILIAIVDGKKVQYLFDTQWFDFKIAPNENILDHDWLSTYWRIEPDPFEEWLKNNESELENIEIEAVFLAARAAWNAAMEYKNND